MKIQRTFITKLNPKKPNKYYTVYIFHMWPYVDLIQELWQCSFSFSLWKAQDTSVLLLEAVNVTSLSSTCEILSSSSAWSVTDPSLSCAFKSPVENKQ